MVLGRFLVRLSWLPPGNHDTLLDSDRIVDTMKRAFEKHYKDNKSSAEIWIAFIEIPPTVNGTATRIHPAKELVENDGLPEPNLFFHEAVL